MAEDQISSEVTNDIEETSPAVPAVPGVAEQEDEKSPPRAGWRAIVAPVWFLLGLVVGLAAFAGYDRFTTQPTTPVVAPTLDVAVLRGAARDGMLDALATLQAESAQSQGQRQSTPAPVAKDAFKIRPANLLGEPNAKVTLVEYSDFQCPFCGRFQSTVSPQLIEQYVKTGKINFLYKHMAFLGPESAWSAVAAECAANQGKFWEYHDLLFARQSGENEGAFNKDKLIGFGKELGLDMTTFERCVQNDETLDRVRADTQEGQELGVNSTPTFFVNGRPLVGLGSFEQFKAVLEQALQE